jgi:hypothetical protein
MRALAPEVRFGDIFERNRTDGLYMLLKNSVLYQGTTLVGP